MKEYLLLFWNAAGDGQYSVSPEEMQAAMNDWQGWIGNIAMQGKLVATKPIQFDGARVSNGGNLAGPAIRDGQLVTGFLICRAESLSEVEKLERDLPHPESPGGLGRNPRVLTLQYLMPCKKY